MIRQLLDKIKKTIERFSAAPANKCFTIRIYNGNAAAIIQY
jgi:hypothetical protein